MPVRAPRICSCGKVVASGATCPCQAKRAAERKARFDKTRPNSSQRGYGRSWEKARKVFLARPENRFCKWPGCDLGHKGGPALASHVDHIIPHKGDSALRDDPRNWQGLCAHHHNSAKQRLERRNIRKAMP
ncbi:HNH endonuclease [Paracoccus methylovorus]|uniref:HNH endonuclease n=1 Tax=Paracoccus methylovorus TaxID=2812658 RepID=A0ABX7JN44_9RHOB|nr:HNH endonuclease [Paracoccus methylovorus]